MKTERITGFGLLRVGACLAVGGQRDTSVHADRNDLCQVGERDSSDLDMTRELEAADRCARARDSGPNAARSLKACDRIDEEQRMLPRIDSYPGGIGSS